MKIDDSELRIAFDRFKDFMRESKVPLGHTTEVTMKLTLLPNGRWSKWEIGQVSEEYKYG